MAARVEQPAARASRSGRRAAALAVIALAVAPGVVHAAAFTVTSTADAVDSNVGDGRCLSTANGGGCTLRAAIQEADAAGGVSTVTVPAGRYRLTIPPIPEAGSALDMDASNGDLDLNGAIDVKGGGAGRTIIDGGSIDRVFETGVTASAHLSDLTVTGGDSTANGSQEIDLGGGILNKGAITLDRVELVANVADGGGGMFSIPGTSPVIRDSLIAGNRAFSGGGLRLDAGGAITNTTITHNSLLTLPPGGIQKKPVGIVIPLVDEISGWGGGIDHRGGGDVSIVNSTITDNHAIKGGGGLASGQGYAPVSEQVALGRMTLRNTIIASNTSDAGTVNCHVKDQVIASLGHNLASDGSCFLTTAGDHPKTDPLLAALADNGGPTRTFALLPGSPAIDAGSAEGCPTHDQRGIVRPVGAGCDIGAFEYVPAVAVTCRPTVALPVRLRKRARSFDVLVGRRVVARKRRPGQQVMLKTGATARVTLRVRLRNGRTVRVTVRPLCGR
jgi:CSLREA domain-containing protein